MANRIESDSAGTGHWHVGEPPHRGTRRILSQKGIEYEGIARLLDREDLDRFDYIVTMDEMNYRDVKQLGNGKAKLLRFADYAPKAGLAEVPDPYYDGRFEVVYDMVEEAARNLLAEIRSTHDL